METSSEETKTSTPRIISQGVCPIEDGTCPGIKDQNKCEFHAHIIRARFVKHE
jgi:hypothetical protein